MRLQSGKNATSTNITSKSESGPRNIHPPMSESPPTLRDALVEQRRRYLAYRRVERLLEDFVDGGPRTGLRDRVGAIVSGHSASQTLGLGGTNLLGIEEETPGGGGGKLCKYEGDSLLGAVEGLTEACLRCASTEKASKPPVPSDPEADVMSVLRAEQDLYIENYRTLQALLERITDVRLTEVPATFERHVARCRLQSRLSFLKSRIAVLKAESSIFKESKRSLGSYRELFRDVREQSRECETGIRELRESKRKYEECSSVEYEAILGEYRRVKDQIRKIEMMRDIARF